MMASAHIIKAVMGAGSFALPWAFTKSGIVLGPLILMAIAAMSAYTHILLARCRRKASSYCAIHEMEHGGERQAKGMSPQEGHGALLPYTRTAEAVLGLWGGRIAVACTMCASVGVCSAYVVFITDNVCSCLSGECSDPPVRRGVTLVAVMGLVMLSWLRDLRRLAFTSTLGDFAIVTGGCVVMWFALFGDKGVRTDQEPIPAAVFSTMPLAYGAIAFLFCTQFLSLPIEGSMQHPEQWPLAVCVSFFLCAIFNSIFGVVGCHAWGTSVESIVILNLPVGPMSHLVKLCLSADLFFTYPIVIFPSVELLENNALVQLLMPPQGTREEYWAKNVLRAILVCLTALIAISVPHFGLLTDLFGGLGQTVLAFLVPPWMSMVLNKNLMQPNMWAIVAFGALSCVVTTSMSLALLAEEVRNP
eukprot:CAMPEP_0173431342 /NCGR_PEP_ID=MMETSP1357-20121228/9508_1 /TAXON_ID=77926 /ORGANISM="Hemiselmis rufescens, Strain PCC563" /LENGTH=416 /DNA_ID=CAMNT_0014395805 /DNA_START=215 /DNA_END=1465 /DNA_ORIENTATION=-